MTSPNDTTADNYNRHTHGHCCGWGAGANWSGFNIFAMILGFVIFWPIGLFFLYLIFSGRNIRDIPGQVSSKWSQAKSNWSGRESTSDNQVFNDYQQTQYDRIREIKDEIKERTHRFSEFRSEAKRRADEEEFRRFMNESPSRDS